MFDLIIRNGTIVDGSGLPGYRGDVGVRGTTLAVVGGRLDDAPSRQTIDADGKVVAPGFIDPHTHYDAQLFFDPYAYPTLEHGVTSVITGNCSLSLAPMRAPQRSRFARMFRLIEEMPEDAFRLGVRWDWGETFADMVQAVAGDVAVNFGPLVGHSVVRMYVLGDDCRRAATADEVRAMADVLRGALDAGAVGLSTSYVDMEDDLLPVPCRYAEHAELEALCDVLGERGGMLQIVPEFFDATRGIGRVGMLAELSLRHGIPTTFSPLFHNSAARTDTERLMEAVEQAWAAGARVWPQVQTRPIDISWTMRQRSLMFMTVPGWWDVLSGDHASKLAAFRDPTTRSKLVDGMNHARQSLGRNDPHQYVVREVVLDKNRDLVGRTLGDIAAERGGTPCDVLIDLATEEDLGTWFMRPSAGHEDPAAVGSLLSHPLVHIGASDGGAHVGSFATHGDTGLLFSRFVRETGALSLEAAVKKITADAAAIWGIAGRGSLRPGLAADVVVFDPTTIDRGPEVSSADFPGGGTRWIRHSVGVTATVVNGTVTWTDAGGYVPGARAGTVL